MSVRPKISRRYFVGRYWPKLWSKAFWLMSISLVLCLGGDAAYAFTQFQALGGAIVYKHQCARCHGEHGKGKDYAFDDLRSPELIGPLALPCTPKPYQKLRHRHFRDVTDIYDFVSATMPADKPASLKAQQYWNAIAFILQSNGMKADGKRLDTETGKQIVLHPNCASGVAAAGQESKP